MSGVHMPWRAGRKRRASYTDGVMGRGHSDGGSPSKRMRFAEVELHGAPLPFKAPAGRPPTDAEETDTSRFRAFGALATSSVRLHTDDSCTCVFGTD